jgi:hypothetical protein
MVNILGMNVLCKYGGHSPMSKAAFLTRWEASHWQGLESQLGGA